MAVTKKFVIHNRLNDRVEYVLNDGKTSLVDMVEYATNDDKTVIMEKAYRTALNCKLETAYQDMMDTKTRKNAMGGRLGYHIIQSFRPDEVTAEEAHEIAIEFAKRSFNDYEVVIGTHIDKAHIHSHIIVNSVSVFTGKKYRDSTKDLFEGIKAVSDQLCREHGLSVIIPPEEKKKLTYIEWCARQGKRTSWQSLIRMDIDDCIRQAFSYGNFLVLMEYKCYEIKQGKHVAFRPYGKERFARGYKLGEEYSEQNIRNRIVGKDLMNELTEVKTYVAQKQNNLFPKGKITGIKALYVHYLYLLGLVKNNKLPDRAAFVLKEDLLRFEKMTKSYQFVTDRNLNTVEQVAEYKAKCYQTIDLLKEDQMKSKDISKKKAKLYHALTTVRLYETPHQLYMEGYTGMKYEHNEYLDALRILKMAGYKTDEQLKDLEKEKSDITEIIARNANHIRHFRYEIRMCDNVLTANQRIEKKMNELKPHQKNQRREIEHEPSEW